MQNTCLSLEKGKQTLQIPPIVFDADLYYLHST